MGLAEMKARAKARAKAVAAGDRFKLKEDENFIRVLPTPESEDGAGDSDFYELYMHQEVGPDKKFLRCGKDAIERSEGECYLCDKKIPHLIAAGHSEAAQKLKAKWFLVLQVLMLDVTENKYNGPHYWQVGGNLGKNILAMLGSGKRDYTDPVKGYTFSVTRSGQGLKTEYSAPIPDEDPSKIPSKYIDILKPFNQLAELPRYSEQEQKNAWKGVKADDSTPPSSPSRRAGVMDEDEDAPRRRRPVVEDDEDEPAPKAKKKVVAIDEDEDEPAPVKKKKPVPPVEPEDEDDVSDDEDEDAPPPPKSKVKVSRTAPVEPADDDDVPAPKVKAKKQAELFEDEDEPAPVKKKKSAPVTEPDEDEDDAPPPPKLKKKAAPVEPEDEDDAPPPPKAKKKAAAEPEPVVKKKKPAPVVDEDDDDSDPFGDD